MKKFLWMLALSALLAGCASGVKLDEVPVEDRAGSKVTAVPPGGPGTGAQQDAGNSVGQRNVVPAELNKAPDVAAGPNGPRIVYFDYDSFEIKPEFQALMEAHSRYIKQDRNRKVTIEGHTDERGGREYNLALGQKRSEAVRKALGLLGVPDAQVDAVSFGKEKPAATGNDEASLAKNRRAEIVYR